MWTSAWPRHSCFTGKESNSISERMPTMRSIILTSPTRMRTLATRAPAYWRTQQPAPSPAPPAVMATDASCNSERASRSRLFRKLFALATAFVAGAVTLIAAQADKTAAIQTGLRLADTYLAQGDLDRAVSEMQRLVDLDPDNIDILYLAQLVYSELADGTLNKLAILAPASARMQQVIAEHLVNSGNLDRAISHYKKCLELDPHLSGVRYELAEALFQNLPSDPTVEAQA